MRDLSLILKEINSSNAMLDSISSRTEDKRIYLAETTRDLFDKRARVHKELELRNYIVLPKRPLPLHEALLKQEVQTYLNDCSLSIYLLGPKYGVIPEEAIYSIQELQWNIVAESAKSNDLKQIIWLPPDLELASIKNENNRR